MPNNVRQQGIYASTGNPETVNDQTPYSLGFLGGRVTIKQPTGAAPGAEEGRFKTYQYVQVDSTATVAPFRGAVAWWSNKATYLVTTSPTALGRGRVAGAFQNAITLGWFGFIQVQGPATVKFIDAPTAAPTVAGLYVIPSATAGKADALAAGSAATYPPLGVSAGVYDAAQTLGIVDLDVPETP